MMRTGQQTEVLTQGESPPVTQAQSYELPWEWSAAAYTWRRASMNQQGMCMQTFTKIGTDGKDPRQKTQEQHELWRSIGAGSGRYHFHTPFSQTT